MGRYRRLAWMIPAALLGLAVLGQVGVAVDTASVVDEELLGLTTDAGAYETGMTLGLEIVNGVSGLYVEALALLSEDITVMHEAYAPPREARAWLGEVELLDAAGGQLPAGEYSVAVFTSSGAFLATFSIVPDIGLAGEAVAPTCIAFSGSSLLVGRLVTDADKGAEIVIRDGDTLIVALSGNATTGFQWTDVTENAFPVLESVDGPDYVPDPAPPGVGGSGGTFMFRYKAFAAGTQVLGFDYARSWESVPPAESAAFSVLVVD